MESTTQPLLLTMELLTTQLPPSPTVSTLLPLLLSPLPTTLLSRDNFEEEYPKLFISIYEIKIFNTLLLPNFWEYQLKIMVGIYFCIPQLFGTVQLNLQQRLILRELYVFMCLVEGRST